MKTVTVDDCEMNKQKRNKGTVYEFHKASIKIRKGSKQAIVLSQPDSQKNVSVLCHA